MLILIVNVVYVLIALAMVALKHQLLAGSR